MFLAWCTNWRQRRSSHTCCVRARNCEREANRRARAGSSQFLWVLVWIWKVKFVVEVRTESSGASSAGLGSVFLFHLYFGADRSFYFLCVFQVGQVLCVEEEKSWFGSFITRRTKRKLFLFLCSITEYFLHERTRGLPLHSGATSPKTTNTHTSCGSVWFWGRTFWL